MATAAHPLLEIFWRAANGDFPPADGRVEVVAPASARAQAIIAFTAHHFIAAEVEQGWVDAMVRDDPVALPLGSRFVEALAAKLGASATQVDVTLASTGGVAPPPIDLVELEADFDHPRVRLARAFRTEVRVYGTKDRVGLLTLGRGLAGRLDVSFEVEEGIRGRGLGRKLLQAALFLAGGEPLFAQVAPGNASSLRAVLACGFKPIGAEVLFKRL